MRQISGSVIYTTQDSQRADPFGVRQIPNGIPIWPILQMEAIFPIDIAWVVNYKLKRIVRSGRNGMLLTRTKPLS